MTAPALSSILPREMTEFRGRPLFIFSIDVAKPSIIGKTPGGERRVGEITGGRFEGERLQGKILSGGSDWQVVRSGRHVGARRALRHGDGRRPSDRHDLPRAAAWPKGRDRCHHAR